MVQLQQTKQKGFTLLEVLVALSVAVVILTAFTVAVLNALSAAIVSKQHNLATQYAQEAMEIVKQTHDSDFATFNKLVGSTTNSYCLNKGVTSLSTNLPGPNPGYPPLCPPGTGNVDNFDRQIIFYSTNAAHACNNSGSGNVMVSAVVSWEDSKCAVGSPFCHNVKLTECFTSQPTIPTP